MIRTLLLIVALILIIGVVLVATGVVHLNRDQNGVTATVNPVTVGTETRNVTVPVVRTETRQVETPTVTVGNGQAAANNQ
jgi:hypothetical protein